MTRDIVCFHNPQEENGYLSNWYPSTFELGGVTYSSMEQYMVRYVPLGHAENNKSERSLT